MEVDSQNIKAEDSKWYSVPVSLKQGGSDAVIGSGVLVCSELDLLEGERNRRAIEDNNFQGELKKMGRQTSLWLSRYYVLRDNTLFIYQSKSENQPKRKCFADSALDILYLKGLYFEKIKDKNNMFGFSLYHDNDSFRKRKLFHKDETVIDTWIRKLKHHCSFYSVNEFYSQTARLGGGKFSEVYEAKHKKTNMAYALKKIDKTKLNAREKEFLRDEIQIISLLSHPNVVEMREVYETKRWMFIMMEQVQGGELFNYLQNNIVTEEDMALIIKQLLLGIGYLHKCGIIHRDLKPENILIELEPPLNPDSIEPRGIAAIKITDFGLSKLSTPGELTFDCCGTPAYVAPEVLLKVGYKAPVDLWAVGIILYSMVSKQLPFQSNDRKQTFKQIKEKNPDFSSPSFTEGVSPACIDIIKKMLHKSPS